MNAFVTKISRKFDNLSFYQKILVCVASICFLYAFWSFVIDQSFMQFRSGFSSKAKVLEGKIEEMKLKINEASDIVKNNPKEGLSQQIDDAKKTSAALDKKIHERTVNMVSPKDMSRILGQVIQESNGLVVVKMENLEKKILVQSKKTDDTQKADEKSGDTKNDGAKKSDTKSDVGPKSNLNIFEHGLSIEMTGGYFETLDFLKALEKRHLSVVWDEINYEVVHYPDANIKILMHTLSLDEDWIGV